MKLLPLLPLLLLALGAAALAQQTPKLANEPVLTPRKSGTDVPLFNGKDLDGWAGNKDLWSVQDGVIVGSTENHPIHTNTFLVWTGGTVENFELHLKYRLTPLGGGDFANSGVQYRSRVIQPSADGPVVAGYQADCEAGKTYSGILYEERGRGILAQRGQKVVIKADPSDPNKPKIEETGKTGNPDEIQNSIDPKGWTDYVIIAQGNHLQQFINGKLSVDVTDEQTSKAATEGSLALQLHAGTAMKAEFKDITLKELK